MAATPSQQVAYYSVRKCTIGWRLGPTIVFNDCRLKGLYTVATEKCPEPCSWAGARTVEKLSTHDFALKSSSQMVRPELTLASSFLAFTIHRNHQILCMGAVPYRCVCL